MKLGRFLKLRERFNRIFEGAKKLKMKYVNGIPTYQFKVEDDVVYLKISTRTRKTTGPKWIKRFEKNGNKVILWARDLIRSISIEADIAEYHVVIFRGDLFLDKERNLDFIRETASEVNLITPEASFCCLLARILKPEDFKNTGLSWILTMHKPIRNTDGEECMLKIHPIPGKNPKEEKIGINTIISEGQLNHLVGGGYAFIIEATHPRKKRRKII